MKYFISLAILLFGFNILIAQNKSYYLISEKVLAFNFSDFNYRVSKDYPSLENYVFELQIGKHFVLQKGSIGLNLFYLFNKASSIDSETFFEGYGFNSKIEYDLISKKQTRIFSLMEFGVRKYNIILSSSKTGGFSIYDILNKPINNYIFSNIGNYLDFGLGINYYFNIWKYDLGTGISSGYRINIGDDWKYEGINDITEPIVKTSGFFISINMYMNFVKKDN